MRRNDPRLIEAIQHLRDSTPFAVFLRYLGEEYEKEISLLLSEETLDTSVEMRRGRAAMLHHILTVARSTK